MTITREIDSINIFTMNYEVRPNITRITFEEVDYFVFPLMMFKNFHV